MSWFWLNNDEWVQINAEDARKIEEEYLEEKNGTRYGQRVFHCFGNGWSTAINYSKMETYCSSGRCALSHDMRGLSDNHLTFKLMRK